MKKQTVVVIGSQGFIGSRIIDKLNSQFNIIGLNRNIMDITDKDQVFDQLDKLNYDWLIHAAARAHIDNCEKDRHLGKCSETWKVNVDGSNNIALASAKLHKRLLYLSTECVFDGAKGFYKENDLPNPRNWYGITKYQGELKVMESRAKFCILRAVLAYGHPQVFQSDLTRVFYKKLQNRITLKAVSNQHLNVTFIDDLIDAISLLLENKAEGIYHYGGNKSLSPYEIAIKLKKVFRLKDIKLIPVTLLDYFGKNANFRLINAILSCNKIQKDFGIKLSSLDQALNLLPNRY